MTIHNLTTKDRFYGFTVPASTKDGEPGVGVTPTAQQIVGIGKYSTQFADDLNSGKIEVSAE